MQPLYLDSDALTRLLPMHLLIPAMENALCQVSLGTGISSPRHVMSIRDGSFGMMAGSAPGILGAKVVAVIPENVRHGLNPHQGIVALFDPVNGRCLCLGDASQITALRTAAASAAATKLLSREDSKTLAVVGAGTQAEQHIHAIRQIRKIQKIKIYARDAKRGEAFAEKFSSFANIEIARSPADAASNSDILCLCTPSKEAYLRSSEIPEGCHVNAIGACRPGMVELTIDSSLAIYVDSQAAVREEAEELKISGLNYVELGEVISGRKSGRTSEREITLFKSVGIGLEDSAALALAYERSRHG